MKVLLIACGFVFVFIEIVNGAKDKEKPAAAKDDAAVPAPAGGGKKSGGSFPPMDEQAFSKYKSQVCDAVPAFKGETLKNFVFMDEMTETDIYELAFLNMAYGLTSDSISHLQEDMGWQKRVLDIISLITKQSCENSVVPEMYINVAKNLFLYYVYKKGKSPPTSIQHQEALHPGVNKTNAKAYKESTWTEIITMLEQCATSITPIPISTTCDIADHVTLPSGEQAGIAYAEERLDIEKAREGYEFVDEVIDAVWWMFSTAYARCYTVYYPREDWVVQFFDNFRQEFLNPFVSRWRNPGPLAEYFPIIFGPFDFRRAKLNMRFCNGAAYQYEGIPERQLVRPVQVTVDSVQMLNFKTGVTSKKR